MYALILVPVNGNPTSDRGLQEVVKLAKLTGALLRLVHVVGDLVHATGMDNVLEPIPVLMVRTTGKVAATQA